MLHLIKNFQEKKCIKNKKYLFCYKPLYFKKLYQHLPIRRKHS